jgi:hypothetical protein
MASSITCRSESENQMIRNCSTLMTVVKGDG